MGLCGPYRCGCALQSTTLDISGDGTGANPWVIDFQAGTLNPDDMSIEMLEVVCPAGTIRTTVYGVADGGWLLMGQTVANAQGLYPTLWDKVPTAWKAGTALILPTDDEMVLRGQTGGSLGAVSGSNTKTIDTANLPAHAHPIDHDHPNGNTGTVSADHVHSYSGTTAGDAPAHSHSLAGVLAPGGTAFTTGVVGIGGYLGQTGGPDVAHAHGFSGMTSGISANHYHGFDTPAFAGTSGNTGSATGLNVQEAAINVRFQIKAH